MFRAFNRIAHDCASRYYNLLLGFGGEDGLLDSTSAIPLHTLFSISLHALASYTLRHLPPATRFHVSIDKLRTRLNR